MSSIAALALAEAGDIEQLTAIANDASKRASGALAVQSSTGATPLFLAAMRRRLACVRLLLAHADDAGVNLKDGHERTALHVALDRDENDAHDADEIAALLVATPAVDVCAADAFGVTPLHLACKAMRVELAMSLISRGSRVDALTTRGQTPLHWTITRATTTIATTSSKDDVALMVQLLLAHGADPTLTDSQGLSPLALIPSTDTDARLAALRILLTDHVAQRVATSNATTTTTTTTTAAVINKKPVTAKKTLQIKLKS
jgi:ankyrin repeat protein